MAEPGHARPRILHVHSGFNLGGKEARAVRLMNLWAGLADHSILSAQPGAMGARAAIAPDVVCDFPDDAPSLQGKPSPMRYYALARYMQRFDLVLTYNWGSMDAVGAHRLYSPVLRLPPLIHHEDGFNEDEAVRLNGKRNAYRRLTLGTAFATVVPSTVLERIATDQWGRGPSNLHRIPNGIDVAAYASPPTQNALPGLVRSPGKLLVGTLAGLRKVKNIARLLRIAAPLRDTVQLVIVGDGPERADLERQAADLGLSDIHFAGFQSEPHRFVGLFDIFALSSDSEQFPISLVEAMAAGLPVLSTDVGDVRAMVAPENAPFVLPHREEANLVNALLQLCDDPALRSQLGAANRARAVAEYDEAHMVQRYADLYARAIGDPHVLRRDAARASR